MKPKPRTETEHSVPYEYLERYAKSSCIVAVIDGTPIKTFHFKGKEYTTIGAMSSGAHGYYYVQAARVFDTTEWAGVRPKKYPGYLSPEFGYQGMIARTGSRSLVLSGEEIKFLPITPRGENKKLTLF